MYSDMAPKKEYKKNNSLLEKYIKGMSNKDKESLINFYEATKNDVYAFVLSIMKNKEDAEDVLQDVYIKVYDNADVYQFYGKPLAWTLTIAKNLCYSKFRKKIETIDIDEMYGLSSDDETSEIIEKKLILQTAFEKISDEERNIIVLHVVTGLKHREIAMILDMRLSTVLSKYNRAMRRLKKILEEDIR